MKVVPFEPVHALSMELQTAQSSAITDLPESYLYALKQSGIALTALHDSKPIACAGIAILGGEQTLWAYLSKDSGRHFVVLDRLVRKLLKSCGLPCIEATVERDFEQGCRWLKLLGFQLVGLEKNYGIHGEDHLRYIWQPSFLSSQLV